MSGIFYKKIESSLQNPALQAALDGNADRRKAARASAYASLPEDLVHMRQQAHRVRAQVIANLPGYLEQFMQNVKQNGMIVHTVPDAAKACQIILEIAQEKGATLIAKSKTMVGEEISINSVLESAGIQVVETDLGEYIVQLRGEPPAHIITPAVHLRRSEVASTFQEKLGISYDEDISAMTETARKILRETFLDADIGISGVNFGVAESGSLCILTNEGNGRMVTTLPGVHIALMGIERLVPTVDDLALMLYLLPRSATGQKLTVYTNIINGPRRLGELDGALERHVILVDNGRLKIRDSNLAEILYCIRCGACINACPIFREIGGHAYVGVHGEITPYPGPIGSVLSPGLLGQSEFGQLARATTLCGACREACPVDIDLPKLLLRVRAGGIIPVMDETPPEINRNPQPAPNAPTMLGFGLRVFRWFAVSSNRFAFAQKLVGFGSRLLAPASDWIRLPDFTGWGYGRDFPRPAKESFQSRFDQISQNVEVIQGSMPLNQVAALSEYEKVERVQGALAEKDDQKSHRIDQFRDELTTLGGYFYSCSQAELNEVIIEIIQNTGFDEISAWAPELLPEGLCDTLASNGIKAVYRPNPAIRVGLTGASAGIAESGSILLLSGQGKPQAASLLTEIHIAVLMADQIYQTLPEALSLPGITHASNAILISGPSRTADIEMTLTIGVHGPRELHLVCVE